MTSVSDPPSDDLTIAPAEIIFDLPAPLAREIGLVIAAYANLENRLNILLYMLLDVPSAYGRLAVREPRATDRFELAIDLIALRELPVDENEIADLKAAIQECGTQRDQLAHGIWIQSSSGQLYLRLTRGSWQPVEHQRGKTKRPILPEAIPYGVADCRSLRKLLYGVLKSVEEFGSKVEGMLRASPDIHDLQSRLVDRIRGHTRGKPSSPPRASP